MENGNLVSMVNHRISSLWHHHLTLTGQNRILNKAMTYSNTVEDIMNGNSQNVVIYSNDGPSLIRTSNFVAQSFNTRDFLAELIQTTLEILSAATGCYVY